MKGQNHIKVFDERLDPYLLSSLPSLAAGRKVYPAALGDTDGRQERLSKALQGLFRQYQFFNVLCPRDDLLDMDAVAFHLEGVSPHLGQPFFTTAVFEDRADAISLVIFLEEGATLRFPTQGITFRAVPGRAVVFPSNWTHPHQLSGVGTVIHASLRYYVVPSIIGTN